MEESTGKAVLQPRKPGESLKRAETVLKRRDRNLKAAAERAAHIAKLRKGQKDYKKGKLKIVRIERLVKDAQVRQSDRHRLVRQKRKRQPKVSSSAKVLIAVRNARLGGSKEVRATLKALGLGLRDTMVFQRNLKPTIDKLHICRPFVFWGTPTFQSVMNIIHKKASFRDPESPNGKSMLSDNTLIEKHLGDMGCVCTEDLAHVIYGCSKDFEKVVSRLWPVSVGDERKANGLVHESKFTYGDQGKSINAKMAKLLGN